MNHLTGKIGALALLLCATLPAAARGENTENSVTFGSRWWWQSAPEARYREYLDLNRGGFLESFSMSAWNGKDAFSLTGDNALRLDQTTRLALSRGVSWQLELKNSQLPHMISAIARTPYTEIRPGVFTIPDSIQARGEVSNPAGYANLLRDLTSTASPVSNTIQTDVSTARLRGRPIRGWRFDVRGERRERTGYKPYGASFGFNNAIELLEPIRQRTVDGQVMASYEQSRVKAQASVGVSVFKNFVSDLVWDNPKRLTDRSGSGSYSQGNGASQGRIDLYPDNQVVRGNVSLGFQLPQRTQFSASVGVSQGTQDDDWLPYANNSTILQSSLDSLPGRSTDAKMTRINMDYRLTTRAWSRARGTLRYNRAEADNKTPEHFFTGYGVLDGEFTFNPHHTHPFGNTNSTLGADADVEVMDGLSIGITGELRQREHTHREVEKDDETIGKVRAHYSPAEDVHVLASFSAGKRELDEFIHEDYLTAAGVAFELDSLRRFDVANRDQHLGDLEVGWDVTSWLGIGAQYNYRLNKYPDSVYGLTREEEHLVVAQGTLRPDDRTELSGGYGFGRTAVYQNSNESNHTPPPDADLASNWRAALLDRNVYVFFDGQWWAIEKKVALNAGYQFNRTMGNSDLFSNTAIDLPVTFYRQTDVRLGARWLLAAGTELAGRWVYEELTVEDYLKENIPLVQLSGTNATSVWLGNSALGYHAHRLELLATRRF